LRISKFLKSPTVKILVFIYKNKKVRYRDLGSIVESRGSLSNCLNSLLSDGLVVRQVNVEKVPVESYYLLTEKGRKIASYVEAMRTVYGLT